MWVVLSGFEVGSLNPKCTFDSKFISEKTRFDKLAKNVRKLRIHFAFDSNSWGCVCETKKNNSNEFVCYKLRYYTVDSF